MAFVLVQHMDPKHESMLHHLLEKDTAMSVAQVTDGTAVQPNHVYVIPPDAEMSIHRGVLKLIARGVGPARYTPIDSFLRALAEDQTSRAIGIVLSGIGSDGTKGLQAIKDHGGITLAQDEESARYSGMPLHAAAAGCVDLALPPNQLAREVAEMIRHPYLKLAPKAPGEPALPTEDSSLRQIFHALRSATGVDFSNYKQSTIQRRIARRMVVRRCETLTQYARYIAEHPDEVNALFQDVVIHVTSFFRDPETFEYLKASVLPRLSEGPERADPIRIWVVGCSSGEEVYSIAMVLHEVLGKAAHQARVQIFATDISEPDIQKARVAIYPESSTANITPERLRRYFVKTEGGYQVVKFLRDWCVFAPHDVTRDPPFSRIDVVSCRNLLIYLNAPLQRKVLTVLHYALKQGGHLVLGTSESVTAAAELFFAEDRKANIYVKVASPQRSLAPLREFEPEKTPLPAKPPGPALAFDLRQEAERVILERYAPAGLVVDAGLRVIHFQGDTGPFLKPAPGEASFSLLKLVAPPLMLEIRGAVQEAKKTATAVRREDVRFKRNGHTSLLDLAVVPIAGRTPKGPDFLVLFENLRPVVPSTRRAAADRSKKTADARELDQLKRELATTQDNLRGLVSDHEASVEELRAANEEILSSNEELQSTNEELETAKEELQSSNEELTTVNEELQNRNLELSQTASDLNGVLNTIDVPIVILGTDRRIRRFTVPASRLLNLVSGDVGCPIGQIRPKLDVPNLDRMAGEVIRSGRPEEVEAQDEDGRWYALRVRPYRTPAGQIDGALITAIDINHLKQFSTAIVQTIGEAVLVLDGQLRVRLANPAFCTLFQLTKEKIERHPLFDPAQGRWNAPELHDLLTKLLTDRQPIVNYETEQDFPIVGRKAISLSAYPLTADEGLETLLLVITDITERKRADDVLLRHSRQELESLSARLLTSTEDQRKEIARELHDVIGQKIALLALRNSEIQQLLPDHTDAAAEKLRAQQELINTTAQDTQHLDRGLHPAILELGLAVAVRSECDAYSRRTGTTVNVSTEQIPDRLPEATSLAIYRITQEALQNIWKHAESNRVDVRLAATTDEIELVIEDFGKGFKIESVKGRGLGLVSMHERARLAGGSLSVTNKIGDGTVVQVRIPLPRAFNDASASAAGR